MISSDYIHDLIVHPEKAGADDLSRLHELTELYPYSSTFSVLYLKALSNGKDVRLESEIEKLAYRVSSRTVLYDLLHSYQKEMTVKEEVTENATENIIETIIEAGETPTVVEEKTEETEAILSQDDMVETELIEEVLPLVTEIPVENQISVKNEEIEVVEPETTEPILEETEIVESETIPTEIENTISEIEVPETPIIEQKTEIVPVISSSYSDDWEEEGEVIPLAIENRNPEKIEVISVDSTPLEENKPTVEEKSADEKELDKLIVSSAVSAGFLDSYVEKLKARVEQENALKAKQAEEKAQAAVEKTVEIQVIVPTNQEITEEKSENNSTTRSFSSWLHASKSSAPIVTNVVEKEVAKTPIEEPTTEPEVTESQEKRTFIPAEKPKKEFFSPAKKAKESLDENRMPVSETLARIFVLQGNYPKAIHVYEQLILIIPEKKSFFATQIKILKKKINS